MPIMDPDRGDMPTLYNRLEAEPESHPERVATFAVADEQRPTNYQVTYGYRSVGTREGFVYGSKEAADDEVMKATDEGTYHDVIETDAPVNYDRIYEDEPAKEAEAG